MPESLFPRGPDKPQAQESGDAVLLRSNFRRWILCAVMIASAFALLGIELFFELPERGRNLRRALAILLIFGGAGMGRWAKAEREVLQRRDWK